jgi:hypothetical protein
MYGESCALPVVELADLTLKLPVDILKSFPNDKMPAAAADVKLQNPEKE